LRNEPETGLGDRTRASRWCTLSGFLGVFGFWDPW